MTDFPEFHWTKDAEEQLRACIEEGLSASQIASLIGTGRNSVIGKAHRLGLQIGGGQAPKVKRAATAAAKVVRIKRTKDKVPPPKATRPAPALPASDLPPLPKANDPLPESRCHTILELKMFGECRWPLGDPATPEFRYCAADCEVTQVYCSTHQRMAYTTQPKPQKFMHPSVLARVKASGGRA